jgi:uncharacterized protein YciI
MGYAILAFDGADPSRRAAVRDEHLAVITRWAAEGRLALGVPLFNAAFQPVGSLMVLNVPDETHVKEYIQEEPFAQQGVWARFDAHPFRIAPLPYRPLPQPGAPISASRTHSVTLAWDGTDADAPARRAAARPAHVTRIEPFARNGTLVLGGALLDAQGGMTGSITVTAHVTDAAAEAFWNEDPYMTDGVWRRVQRWGTRMVGLPYQPLPGGA